MINGSEYSWEDVQIVMEGKNFPLEGVTEIEYGIKKDHSNIYGKGDTPVAMGRGKKEFSAKINVLQSEFEAMQSTLPSGKDITNRTPFNVTVGYAPEIGPNIVDQLLYCRVTDFKKGIKSGDGNMVVELTLLPGDIKLNII